MQIYTKWISYDGKIGITDNYDYYLMDNAQIMEKEVHQGSIYKTERKTHRSLACGM